MYRSPMLLTSLLTSIVALIFSGCCGPLGSGVGCRSGACSDCDVGFGGRPVAGGPVAAVRNLRRQAICGSGCGEAYIGEWISTPPDCKDPCCNGQFVGGAVKARPFCRAEPLYLGSGGVARALYGKRNCTGDQSSASCGTCAGCLSGRPCIARRLAQRVRNARAACASGTCASGTCSCSEYVGGDYTIDDYTEVSHGSAHAGPVEGGCGCASCKGPSSPMATRLAEMGKHPTGDSITARARTTTQRAQQIRQR